MVAQPGRHQASFNAGELMPEVGGNIGLKQYYAGARTMINAEPVPQGGFRLLPRTRFLEDLGPAPTAVAVHPFTVTRTATYDVILTAETATIHHDDAIVATLSTPYAATEIGDVKATQRGETMFLWHRDHAPRRILRHGDHVTWTIDVAAWLSMPDVDYGETYTNTDEVWQIRFYYAGSFPFTPGVSFVLTVDGDTTTMISIADNGSGGADWTATMAAVVAAVEGLPAIDPGVTATMGAVSGRSAEFTVTFSGGRNSGANFSVGGSFIDDPAYRSLTTGRTVKGKAGGEALMSSTRGWSSAGAFFQDRLLQAGFRSKRTAAIASRTAEYFDLNTELDTDAGALLINLDVEADPLIHHVVAAQYLCFFTERSEHFITDRALKRNTPPNVVTSSTYGSSPRISPVFQEDGILWVNAEETMVMVGRYDAVSTSFRPEPLSLLSSHLIFATRDAALQASHRATDAQRWFLVRDDGAVVVACLIRNQEVSPFVRWITDGAVRAVSVDGANRVTMLIEREVGGVTRLFRERIDETLLVDAAIRVDFDPPSATVTGLAPHEGADVWAIADGHVEGPHRVIDGTIALSYPAAEVIVGRWVPPVIETMPPARDVAGQMVVLHRPGRIHTVEVQLLDTTSLAIGANGRPPRDIVFARAGDPVDVPTPAYTGSKTLAGLVGWTVEPTVVFTQTRPGRLRLRDATVQGSF